MKEVDPIRSKQELACMKEYLKREEGPRNYLIVGLGVNAALRISDLLSLQVKDVRNPDGTLRDRIDLRESKTGKEKKYRMSEGAKSALRYYFENIDSEVYFGHEGIEQDDYLFASQNEPHDPIGRSWAWRKVKDAAQHCSIEENIATHSLRKTWGYMARTEEEIPLSLIMNKLNHNEESTTLRYIGIIQQEVEQAEEQVSL